MKNLLSILVVLALATTLAFSTPTTINDNTGGAGKTGTGTFSCTVLTPLSIAPLAAANTLVPLGEFVVSATAYTLTTNNSIEFTVSGQNGHAFFYTITEAEGTSGSNSINIDWFAGDATAPTDPAGMTAFSPGTLNSTGNYYIKAVVTTVKADVSTGNTPATFAQSVTVSYNNF